MMFQTFRHFRKTLAQFDAWFDKAEAFAAERKFDTAVYLETRLAVDQLPFVRQVQIACDTTKLGAKRLTGKDVPSHADDEKTLAELRARVKSVIAWLDTLVEQDFAGAAEAVVTQPRWQGKSMRGADYFQEHVVPNFYFHASHVYALLRHAGVPLGKMDYLGALTLR